MTASLVRWEPFPECIEAASRREVNVYRGRERRNRPRAPLRWPVRISGADGGTALETRTENLSPEGFYCLVSEAIMPGQRIECMLELPSHGREGESTVFLRCQARVIRVETADVPEKFGIGCRIDQYSVVVAETAF